MTKKKKETGSTNNDPVQYKFMCEDCGTIYKTSRPTPPSPINWADGHKCKLIQLN